MKNYDARIKETLEMTVSVEADSMAQAKDIVEKRWKDGDYILDASHFKEVNIGALYPKNRDYER